MHAMSIAPTRPIWTRRTDGFEVVYPEDMPWEISHGALWIFALVIGITLASIFFGADPTQAMVGDVWDAAQYTVTGFVVLPLSFIGAWRFLVEPRLRTRHAVWVVDAGPQQVVVRRTEEGVDDEVAEVPLSEITAVRFEPGRMVIEGPDFPLYVPLSEELPYAGTDIVEALAKHVAA